MGISKITFENYKAFKNKQSIDIKPITILIGKNSSGKSAIAKLLTLIDNALSYEIKEPLLIQINERKVLFTAIIKVIRTGKKGALTKLLVISHSPTMYISGTILALILQGAKVAASLS